MPRTLFRWLNRAKFAPFADLPGPEPTWPLGNAAAFGRGWPWERCADWARDHGGLVRIFLGSSPALVVSDPALIGEILVERWTEFHKDAPCAALVPVITRESLFISNLPAWKAARENHPLRQIPAEPWHAALLEPLRATLGELGRGWVERSAAGPLELFDQTQRMTFAAFARAFWGRAVPDTHYDWFQTLARTGSWRMELPDWWNRLNWFSPRFRRARTAWYDTYQQYVREARARTGPADSVTQADSTAVTPTGPGRGTQAIDPRVGETPCDLLHVTLAHGSPLADAQLAEALATNYFGGVFSCSSALNTALWQLANAPGELARLRAALDRDLPRDQPWTLAALTRCEPLDHVIREALRIAPPVPMYFRSSPPDRETTLGGHRLPPGTNLFVMQWYAHREDRFWEDPHVFRPSRWENGFATQHPYGSPHFFPFGRGPRACVGGDFALFHLRLALAVLVSAFDCAFTPDSRPVTEFFFGVMMPRGLRARWTPRPA